MNKILVTGGKPLKGDVAVSGAKNSALPLMAASLLTPEPLRLSNVPHLKDIETMKELLMGLGVEVVGPSKGEMKLRAAQVVNTEAPYELVKTMRASVLVLGPLLARRKKRKGKQIIWFR